MNPDYKTHCNRIHKLHSVFIMQSILYLTTLLCLALLPVSTFAWSATGHMSVAQIAYERLHPAAKKQVDRLINVLAPFDPKVNHFVPAATWMDMLRGYDIKIFDQLHYISLPYNPYGLPSVREPNEQNVVWGIEQAILTLKSENAADFQKALMLRMLIHFVGDVHQPLHAAERYSPDNPDGELGGNLFPIEIGAKRWKRFDAMNPGNPSRYLLKRPTNLHAIWDEIGLLYPFVDPMHWEDWSRRIPQIVEKITEKFGSTELSEVGDLTPMTWAQESNKAAITHAYHGIVEGGKLSDAYIERTREVATRRIAVAGYRLAAVLHAIYSE
ncbi:hypothetical protein NKDENANG_01650 [Candidatus Entotheonellaceae bacterium PAL068K]